MYDGEVNSGGSELSTPFLDVLGPLVVVLETVGGDSDDLYIALREVRCPGALMSV